MPIIAGAAIGLGSGLYQTISGSKQQKRGQQAFEKAMAARPQYEISDTVKQQLAEAQSRYNSQNPAIAMAYQQAQQGMAGQMANAQRNASSGAQALAAGAGAQAQLQSIVPQLAAQQAAFQQQQQANLNQARGLMSQEEKTKFSDMLSTNQARQNYGLGLAQAGSAMKSQGLGAIAQGGLGLATAGLSANLGKNKTIPKGVDMDPIKSIDKIPQRIMNDDLAVWREENIRPIDYWSKSLTWIPNQVKYVPRIWSNQPLTYNDVPVQGLNPYGQMQQTFPVSTTGPTWANIGSFGSR